MEGFTDMTNKNSKVLVLKRECPKCGTKAMRPMVEKKTVILENFVQDYVKDKNFSAHFRKKCPLECEGIKTFVQN